MPAIGTPSPASTPQLMLENNYRQLQDWGQRQEQELQSLNLDDEMFNEKLEKLQTDFDKKRADIEANMNTVRQSQHWIDMGIIDSATGERLKWGAVVPKEALDMMFPEPETGPGFYRRPFTSEQMKEYEKSVEKYAEDARTYSGPGKNQPSFASLFTQYKTWQTAIGYHGGLSNAEQRQVDNKWDAWVREEYPRAKWDSTSRAVRALRAKGPITRGVDARFRGTPIGPTEVSNPLKDNVIANLPKQPEVQPEPEPQPEEAKPARIHAKNKKTGQIFFSDDGGRTWQKATK